ncbi:hypothetical protein OG226_36580 [Streptomyces sp. NBC_01261]|uniref:hypothetical protein n=1 Tax=Streptomyces sp. NBC_01261 TaxID=2903802 RepID=UPI002E33276B|nr:hypothetical protein [Streptomyces sp. NBC_01261]
MHLENDGEGDDRSPREMYRVLTALPADEERTVKFLRHENAVADRKGRTQAQSDCTGNSVLLVAHLITGTRMLLFGTVVGGSSTAAWAVVDKAGERG